MAPERQSPEIGFAHNGEVAPDSAWSGRKRVGGTEKRCQRHIS